MIKNRCLQTLTYIDVLRSIDDWERSNWKKYTKERFGVDM